MLRIKDIRIAKGYGQCEFAKKIKMSQCAFSHVENNECDPRLSTLVRIADGLGVSIDALVGRSQVETKRYTIYSEGNNILIELKAET